MKHRQPSALPARLCLGSLSGRRTVASGPSLSESSCSHSHPQPFPPPPLTPNPQRVVFGLASTLYNGSMAMAAALSADDDRRLEEPCPAAAAP